MEKKIKYLIIPDVHCRDFWKAAVKEVLEKYPDAKILFLGDYLDGYSDEWEHGFDYTTHGIENFKEIIDLKRNNSDRMTLLLGNHDGSYAIGENICSCRRDRRHAKEIISLFRDNRSLFKLIEEADINGKHIVFSHAGVLKKFFDDCFGKDVVNKDNFAETFNKAWLEDDDDVLDYLEIYDRYRGWGGTKYASFVWSDIRSWVDLTADDTFGYNVVGHTICKTPIKLETIVNLDCQIVFYIDDEGKIRYYDDDQEI